MVPIINLLDQVMRKVAAENEARSRGAGTSAGAVKIPIRDSDDPAPAKEGEKATPEEGVKIDGSARSLAQRASENV